MSNPEEPILFPYRAVTAEVEVSVLPEFSENRSDASEGKFFWLYTIEIANFSEETVQLRSRYWRITDARGKVQEVRGPGVVGEQPILNPGDRFRYTSGCPLETSDGMMVGSYQMAGTDGRLFEVNIPAFSLDSPHGKRVLN
jgi:ApaG protein